MPVTSGLYYSEHKGGQGKPPVVLIHGAGSSHLVWPPLMRRLPGWTILALDLPAHGRSAGPACRSVTEIAARILAFLAEKHAFQVVLVGHSLGAGVALHLALEHPALVCGLGLISGGAHFDVPGVLREAQLAPGRMEEALRIFKQLAFSPFTSPARCEQLFQPLLRLPPGLLAADWHAGAIFDARARMQRLEMPAWLAAGKDDRLTPPSSANFLKQFLPQAHLQVVAGAGHFLPLEQPTALSDGFCSFLARLE